MNLGRRLFLLPFFAVACAPSGGRIFVPFGDEVKAILVAVDFGGGNIVLHAREPLSDEALIDVPDPGSAANIYVLQYAEPLVRFDVEAGTVPRASEEDPLAAPIPSTFVAAFALTPGDEAPRTLGAGVLPEALAQFRYQRSSPCFPLVSELVDLDVHRQPAGMVAVDRGILLISNRSPGRVELIQLVGTGVGEVQAVIDATAGLGASDGASKVFVVGPYGPVERNFIQTIGGGGAELAPMRPGSTSTSSRIVAIVGRPAPLDTAWYTLDGAGVLQVLENGAWRTLWTKPAAFRLTHKLAWAPPDDVYLVVDRGEGLDRFAALHWSASNGPVLESIPSSTGVTAVERVGELGVFSGAGRGATFRRVEGSWIDLGPTPLGRQVAGFAQLRDGVVVGNLSGSLAIWFEGPGFCSSTLDLRNADSFLEIVPDGDSVLTRSRPSFTSDVIYRVSAAP